jgi:hypothetical protein
MLSLGGLLMAIIGSFFMGNSADLIKYFAVIIALGLIFEAVGLIFHARDLKSGEGQAAHYEQSTTFGKRTGYEIFFWFLISLLPP